MKKLRYALIGCGRISPNHIKAAIDNDLDIVGLCDTDRKNAECLAEKFNLTTVGIYTDYEKMLQSNEIDIAAIATESGNHAAIALDCIGKEVNILIEKPIALSLMDTDNIMKAAIKNNVTVSCCHQNRFNLSVQKLHSAVTQNRFGRISHIAAHIRWNRGKSYYEQAKWRGTWAQDGGCFMNQCIHNIDLLRWLMNSEVDEVFAYTENFAHPYIEAEDTGLAVVKFKNGSLGLIEGTVNVYPKNLEETLYVFGERGTAKLGGTSVNRIEEWAFEDGLDTLESVKDEFSENPPNVYGFGHAPLYADFIDALENNREPSITALEGKRSIELILAIYKSSKEGKPVKLPLDDCSTVDFVRELKQNY
ncbi:MAG: Gfo/Idh/MocA family oxidoreductase [Oscillospiraceae bacterium]|nr:Gfo/Idh/MocA family oxidoreductase [Oscillospiraceae bacterium]MCL2279921.1 Gfo/Idh/MocA family oxidoreductase [Oscillospiraceae bacterium]